MLYCLNPSCPNPVNPTANRHCQHCGDRLALRNRFRALRPIGQGGFGKTYLAQDQDNRNKLCVVKRFTYVSADPSNAQKAEQLFEQEAERLDQLLHPQIPRLLAYFQEGDYLYLVQEFIVGKTLQDELNEEGKFSEAKIKAVLQGLLPILQFIHSHKVIHRDLKPDNIMRRQTGELVLIDFGVAKLLEQSGVAPGNSGKIGTTIGTPGYAAPEQIRGRVSPASDLFALGATCFQLMTKAFTSGQISPVEYDWVQRWQQHTDSSISPELDRILSRLITVDDQQRYSTATAVLRDLEQGQPSEKATVAPDPFSAIATVAVAPAYPIPQSPASVAILEGRSPQSNSLQRPVKSVPLSGGFWLKYGLLTDIGSAVGFAVSMVAAVLYTYAVYGDFEADVLETIKAFGYLFGGLGGFLIGLGQWFAIKKWVDKAAGWLLATNAGFAMSAIAFMNISNSGFCGLLMGAFTGGLQWAIVLRPKTPRGRWWILWMAVIYAMTFRVLVQNPASPVYAIGWFAIAPFLDGLFLIWVLRTQYDPPK